MADTAQVPGDAADQGALRDALADILLASFGALAEAGELETACRLAGRACVAARGADRAAERRFDVLLHRLSPKLDW